jgi:hypothetical protein
MEKTRQADGGCIEWTAYCGDNGYGRFYLDGKGALAHRWSYEHHVGPIPDGLVIDHLCRNHACVNPEHLEPVTAQENYRRGVAREATREHFAAITHCKRGHEFDEANTRLDSKGNRACLSCKRAKAREHYENNRANYIDKAREWRLSNPDRAKELGREAQRRQRAKRKAA